MLPIRQPGLEVHRIEMLNGSKEFCQEFLTDVRVPDTDRVGEIDDGWTVGTRWMFHERMLTNSPLVTVPSGDQQNGDGAFFVNLVARDAGRLDDPRARELVGEAHMLDLVNRKLRRRIGDGIATGTMADQSAAIGRLFAGVVSARIRTIAFDIAGTSGGAWTDDDGEPAFSGTDFLMRQVSCIGGGTTEMARNVISERVLGMPRERALTGRGLPRRAPGRILRGSGAERSSGPVPLEEEHTGRHAASRGDHRGGGVGHLSLAGIVAELHHGLIEEPEAVGPPLGELPAVGIDRQLPVEGDPPTPVQPVVGLAEPAESEGLEPRDGVEGEAVVEQGQVDVGRSEARSATRGGPTGPAPGARG